MTKIWWQTDRFETNMICQISFDSGQPDFWILCVPPSMDAISPEAAPLPVVDAAHDASSVAQAPCLSKRSKLVITFVLLRPFLRPLARARLRCSISGGLATLALIALRSAPHHFPFDVRRVHLTSCYRNFKAPSLPQRRRRMCDASSASVDSAGGGRSKGP